MRISTVVGAALVAAFAGAGAGCAGTGGAWSAQGFEQTTFGWKASYRPNTDTLVGPDWRLDNWGPADGGLSEKTGRGYTYTMPSEIGLRFGGEEVHFFDLKFTNTHSDGLLWAKSWPLKEADGGKDLDVLLERYAPPVNNADLLIPAKGLVDTLVVLGYGRDRIVNQTPIQVGGHPALSALVEAHRIVGGAPVFIRVVILKFRYWSESERKVDDGTVAGPAGAAAVVVKRTISNAFMTICYVNDKPHFETGLADLAAFIERLSWDPAPAPDPESPSFSPAAKPGAAPPAGAPPPVSDPPEKNAPPKPEETGTTQT